MSEEFEFVALDPEEEALIRGSSSRGKRIAASMLQSFLKSGLRTAKLGRQSVESSGQKAGALVQSVKIFAKAKEIPVNCIMRGGEVYLLRTDPIVDQDA